MILDYSSSRNMWYVLYFLPFEMHILRYRAHFLPDHQGPFLKYKKVRFDQPDIFQVPSGSTDFLTSHFTSYHLSPLFPPVPSTYVLATVRIISQPIEAVYDHTIPAKATASRDPATCTQRTELVFDNFQSPSHRRTKLSNQ